MSFLKIFQRRFAFRFRRNSRIRLLFQFNHLSLLLKIKKRSILILLIILIIYLFFQLFLCIILLLKLKKYTCYHDDFFDVCLLTSRIFVSDTRDVIKSLSTLNFSSSNFLTIALDVFTSLVSRLFSARSSLKKKKKKKENEIFTC